MQDWFEKLFREILWAALADFYTGIASWADDQIEAKLKELSAEVGKPKALSSSPLVRVLAYGSTADPDVDNITFLVRGRIPLFKGVESVFMRVEVTISTRVDLVNWDPPIEIVEWHTVTGELKISKANVFSASLGLGYDDGSWLGRGAVKILPAGFGLDLYLGGLSDRGAMIGVSIDLPAAIPLGSTGLGLKGMGGDFAYNFVARLEQNGLPVPCPTAKDYVTWARNTEVLDRWQAGPIDKTSVGVGINTDLVTLADNGRVLLLEPIGMAVLTPGPVFVLGGVGKLLSTHSARVEGYLAVDVASASMALGLGVMIRLPAPESGDSFRDDEKYLVDAHGTLDAFFSFSNPSSWYINLGTDQNKVAAKVLAGIIRAELYLMLNNYRIAFGAGISVGGEWSWWIITLTARLGADVAATIGWNPVLLEGLLRIWAELGLKIWKFGFLLRGSAEVLGHTPDPTKLDVVLKYKLDLPWPIPDIEGDKRITLGDETPQPPLLSSPLLTGQSIVGGVTTKGALQIGLLHALTGRQWASGPDEPGCWPDADVVIPFSSRVADGTGVVVGSAISSVTQGGYVVAHTLKTLTLHDVTGGAPGVPVAGLQAVWAAGPGGDTARLHVLGADPFSWVVPHVDAISTTAETPGRNVQQDFGIGVAEVFRGERRFGELLVKPLGRQAELVVEFAPALATRVLRADGLRLRFRTSSNEPIEVAEVTLLLLCGRGAEPHVSVKPGHAAGLQKLERVYDSLDLVAVSIALSPPTDELTVAGTRGDPLLVFAVRYQEARRSTCNWKKRVVLAPGTYELTVDGESQATYPDGSLPPSETVAWSATETFNVDHPETLRPYIRYTTIGDSRIFDVDAPPAEPPWNPTMHGFGFPIYRQYRAVVRFRVPYMDKIFPAIRFGMVYETGETLEQDLAPAANSGDESYLPAQSQEWIQDHCGDWAADQEVTLSAPFPKSGPAAVRLSFEDAQGTQVKLDEWACYVSAFDSFADHLAWPDECLSVFYGPNGGSKWPASCGLPDDAIPIAANRTARWRRVDHLASARRVRRPAGAVSRWSHEHTIVAGESGSPPVELAEPPVDWRLPASLTTWLAPLDAATGRRFAGFAAEAGARFGAATDDRLTGLNDVVDQTVMEAVTDAEGRPLALWLRTPEPLDWRRVALELRIRHVEQTGDCPSGFASRTPLDLELEALPSPDGSSAFLIGSLAGHRTRLPRGVYTLTLRYRSQVPNLPSLKPAPVIGGTEEQVVYTFVQPSGDDWPTPTTGVVLPAYVLERLTHLYRIDWSVIEQLLHLGPDPRIAEELLRAGRPGPTPPPGRVDSEQLQRLAVALARFETACDRLEALTATPLRLEATRSDTQRGTAGDATLTSDDGAQQNTGPVEGGDA